MASTRIVVGLVVTAASAVLALVACSSSTSGTGTGDGGASSGSSGSSGTSGTSGSNSKLKNCPAPASKCTDAENQTYANCFVDKCNDDLVKCYGPDYKSGTFAGSCGPYITCTQACACGDTACITACPKPTAECSSCLQAFGASCSDKCPAPACASGGSSGTSGTSGTSGGAGKTCADLAACCAKITDASTKSSCDSTYESIKGNDASCNAVYSGYAPSCP